MANNKINKMSNEMQRVVDALSSIKGVRENSNFYACSDLSSEHVAIEVTELGKLTLPLTLDMISKIISISSKAKFGLREQTILDVNVRDTQELRSDQLNVQINENVFSKMLSNMRNQLCLPKKSVLIPYLHNLLVYGPGQFFDFHQDTEKAENMIATLVMVLPSPHIGGDLVIKHGMKDFRFSTTNVSSSDVKCVAFYTDCMHKVEQVKDGYRVALTYNVVLQTATPHAKMGADAKLKKSIADYFSINGNKFFAYFLNHSYTENGLSYQMLKADDRKNVAAIVAVAKELKLIPHLALVDITQTWSTDGCPGEKNPRIEEHISDDVNLTYWINEDNEKVQLGKYKVAEHEICWLKGTNSFKIDSKKYEGYQGNWGGNMEYWYRRAAIVLWPESHQITMNFQLNYNGALDELNALTGVAGNELKVKEIMEAAGTFLLKHCSGYTKSDFDRFANIILYLKDITIAKKILSSFDWKILNSNISESLVKLQVQFGIDFCLALLNTWNSLNNFGIFYSTSSYILNGLDSFVYTFMRHGGDAQIIEFILDVQWKAIGGSYQKDQITPKSLLQNLTKRMQTLYELLAACAAVKDIVVLGKVISYLITKPDIYPLINLTDVFFKIKAVAPSEYYFSHYKSLESYLVRSVESEITASQRDENDWSINVKFSCTCENCNIAACFLRSKTEIQKVWPIAADVRKHIIYKLKELCIPVDTRVEKSGSPHKLVMTKNASLHKSDKKRCNDLKKCFEKLKAHMINN